MNVLSVLFFRRYDILLCNDAQSMFIASFLTFLPWRACKFFGFVHGDEVEEVQLAPSIFKKLIRFDLFYDRFLQKSDKVFFLSRFMADKFCANFSALPPGKAVVINGGVRIDDTIINKSVSKNIDITKPLRLVSVSRIEEQKGYAEMVTVLEKLFDLNFEFEWSIVGDGEFLAELQTVVKASRINSNVKFTGALKHSDVMLVLSESDVFFLLSNYDESFGLAYAEALVLGLPIIAKARGAILDFQELGNVVCISESQDDYLEFLKACFVDRPNRLLISGISQKYNKCNLHQEVAS